MQPSLSIANPMPLHTTTTQKISLGAVGIGVLMLLLAWASFGSIMNFISPALYLLLSFMLATVGGLVFFREEYARQPLGIKNNLVWMRGLTARGVFAWMLGILFTGFYICLYWYPEYLAGVIKMFDPLSQFLRHQPANQWFAYGTLYTISVLLMGVKFAMKYRHNRYQLIRTASVCFFQLGFSFLIPNFLSLMNQPDFYFTYFWPLHSYDLSPNWFHDLVSKGNIGLFAISVSVTLTFIATPVLTYFYGKRWYCSWVCGCGGLAETAGDPFRHLSDKSLTAWRIERWMIYSVLIFITLTTLLLWANSAYQGGILGSASMMFSKSYGFLIGSMFSGVIGVGFYPLMGARVWCRFGCPQAAILGLFQRKKSKFRITTNGGQCISCGNCSTYCEMGIDVRAYAQRGEDIVRASCVGCGICSAVCPRGVLRLENN